MAALIAVIATPLRASFENDWRFVLGDPKGAEGGDFDASAWRRLDLPHDWSIEGAFDKNEPAGGAGAFLPTGVGWYRKHFSLPASDSGKRVFVEFDGVMANSDVFINGHLLGHRPYGYISFRYDLTDHLHFGEEPNVLAVRCDDSKQPASRWYAGAGIYRHARLIVTDPVHLGYHATFVSTPQIKEKSATIRVQTTVMNDSKQPREVKIAASIHGPPGSAPDGGYAVAGESPSKTIAPNASADFSFDIELPWAPRLWDLDHPDMHAAVVRVRSSDQTLDEQTISFGMRDSKFEAATGYWLNGKNFKLKGVCLHADAGAFGAAVPLGAWERRLKTLKSLGVNAIRTAHNPPAPEFLDLCDRLGLLVMDENFDCWTVGKNPYDYHLYFNEWSKIDTRDMVMRDRNHPSIILYSTGNEIHDTPHAEIAKPILAGLVEVFHAADPTRPVTQALFRPNVSHDYDNGLADLLDVVGQNYRENEILAAHEQKPARKIVGTENGHDRKAWLPMRDNPPYAGQFLWTGIDYLGESRRWPTIGSGSGLLDRTGHVKPMGRQRQSWWSNEPMVFASRHVAPPTTSPAGDPGGFEVLRRPQTQFDDWTPTDLSPHQETVDVYSNCESVELSLNGESLGSKKINADASPRTWTVQFAPGTLMATASNGGKVVATHELRTAGKAAKIKLVAEQTKLAPTFDDVGYVTAMIVDDHDVVLPRADDEITFAVSGPGVIAAVDNGDNNSHEAFRGNKRHAYQGRCIAVIKSVADHGQITIFATSPDLAGAQVTIDAVKSEPR
jgi:beta-galactosidase